MKSFLLHELLQKAIGCIGIDIPKDPRITVLTNNRGINGATAVFYPSVLKELTEKHGTSLFLLPSSIHGFIVLEDDGICNPEELKDMAQELNNYAVPPKEILSDSVYYYGRSSGILSVFNNGKREKVAMP